MSMDQDAPADSPPEVSAMTEEEQIAYAMQMSLGASAAGPCVSRNVFPINVCRAF